MILRWFSFGRQNQPPVASWLHDSQEVSHKSASTLSSLSAAEVDQDPRSVPSIVLPFHDLLGELFALLVETQTSQTRSMELAYFPTKPAMVVLGPCRSRHLHFG